LTLLAGRQEGHPACKNTEWWGAGVVICLERNVDLHMAHVRYAEFTPRPVNQAGAQGEEAVREIANGGARPLAISLTASSP